MKQSFKKWYENQAGDSIQNNTVYQTWLDKKYGDFAFTSMLYRKNVEALKFLFGKQFAVYIGEFKYYVWKIDYNGVTFLIFSSNKGTSIEYIENKDIDSTKIGEQAIELVESLVTNIYDYYENEVVDDRVIKCLKKNGVIKDDETNRK